MQKAMSCGRICWVAAPLYLAVASSAEDIDPIGAESRARAGADAVDWNFLLQQGRKAEKRDVGTLGKKIDCVIQTDCSISAWCKQESTYRQWCINMGQHDPPSCPTPQCKIQDSTGPPTPGPTTAPTSGSIGCKAKPNAWQAVTDEHCAPCATGQTWWPCNVQPEICECGEAAPTPAPTTPAHTAPSPSSEKQLVAFVENWKECPSLEKVKGYTTVVISFAVTYTWSPQKNVCNKDCTIGAPVPICGNARQDALVRSWQAAGTKVVLSFGGAGMGGSWDGLNDCWTRCFGKVPYVAGQLKAIVEDQGFDGIDIDYEYFHTEESSQFLKDLTTTLRSELGSNKVITHAPMDGDVSMGRPYFEVLREVASSVSYIMPQYYNGPFRPATNAAPALAHMGDLIQNVVAGDESKVLFGFCIADCSGTGSNVNGDQAKNIIEQVNQKFPNNGGAFVWAASDDIGWSATVRGALGLA